MHEMKPGSNSGKAKKPTGPKIFSQPPVKNVVDDKGLGFKGKAKAKPKKN